MSGDGKAIVSGSEDGIVRLWDLVTGQEVRRFTGHRGAVYSVAISPNGKHIASGGKDKTVRLWDLAGADQIGQLGGHQAEVGTVAFCPDGRTLASAPRGASLLPGESNIRLWDVVTRKEVGQFRGHKQGIQAMVFCRDGKLLASISDWHQYSDRTLRLWDVTKQIEIRHWESNNTNERFTALAFAPDGKAVAVGVEDSDANPAVDLGLSMGTYHVKLWDVVTGRHVRQFHTPAFARCLAFSPDGRTLAINTADRTIQLWNLDTGKSLHLFAGHESKVSGIAFGPDGRTLASGGYDHTLRLWHVQTGQEINRFRGHRQELLCLAMSPDGKHVATGSADHTLRIWQLANPGKHDVDFQAREITSVAFAPDGKVVVSAGIRDWLDVWNVSTGHRGRHRLHVEIGVTSLALSPDGRVVALGCTDGVVRLWKWNQRDEPLQLKGHDGRVLATAFSPDGRMLASGGQDRTIRLWEMATAKQRCKLAGDGGEVSSVAFAPNDKLLASAGWSSADPVVRLWDLSTAQEFARLQGHQSGINSVAFSPDGRKLASASSDTTMLIWNVASLAQPRPASDTALAERDLHAQWLALGAEDASRAYAAIKGFCRASESSARYLKDRITSLKAPDPRHVDKLVGRLQSDHFATREQGAKDLEQFGAWVVPGLTRALAGKPSLETRQRAEELLKRIENQPLTTEKLRLLRAIETLQYLGTREARQALAFLAEAQLSLEAKASLERLARRDAGAR
jgi:WD40 repeat protein